jgi:hypothetical protein
VTPLDIIALKAHVTQLVVNQAGVAQLFANDCSARVTNFLSLLSLSQIKRTFFLTISTDGAVRTAIVSCTTCKKNGHTSDKYWFGAETKLRDAVKQLAEAKMILKSEIKLRFHRQYIKGSEALVCARHTVSDVDAIQNRLRFMRARRSFDFLSQMETWTDRPNSPSVERFVSRLQKVCTNHEKEKENQEDMRGKWVT